MGVRLVNSPKGDFIVLHSSDPSSVVAVNSKKDLNPIFMELKAFVLKKSFEALSQGGDGVLRYQCRLCSPDVDNLRRQILEKGHSS